MWKTNNSGALLSNKCCPHHRIMTGNAFSEVHIIDRECVSNQEENPTQSTKGAISFLLWWVDVIDVLIIPNCCTHYCQGFRNSLYGSLGQAEALAVPIAARLDRISEFVRWCSNNSVIIPKQYFSFKKSAARVSHLNYVLRCGPVNFDTLVLHTGSGDIAPLSTYFNR